MQPPVPNPPRQPYGILWNCAWDVIYPLHRRRPAIAKAARQRGTKQIFDAPHCRICPMTAVTFERGTVQIDAMTAAAGLQIAAEDLRIALRDGSVTSLCEVGKDEDAGRWRLTFFSATRRLRLVVDATGTVLQSSAADFRRKPNR